MEYIKNKNLYADDGRFWFDEWRFKRPTIFTGKLNQYYAWGKTDNVKKNNTHFIENLHKKVFKKTKKQITRLVIVEKGSMNKKLHTHLVVETPIHLSRKTFERFIIQSWNETNGGINSYDFTPIYYLPELKEYLGKDQDLQTERGVDEINSYTNKSVSINS